MITCRPADLIKSEFEDYKEKYKSVCRSDEDVLSCALFPQVAPKLLAWRNDPEHNDPPTQLPGEKQKAVSEVSADKEIRVLMVEDLSVQ